MKTIYLLTALAVFTINASAQDTKKGESADAIKKLAFFAGEWRGAGWFKINENKDSLSISESIAIGTPGTSMQMDLSSEIISSGTTFTTNINLTYEEKSKKYLVAVTSGPNTTNGEGILLDDHTLQCKYSVNAVISFKYTYSVLNNVETIIGEMTADNGATWSNIFWASLSK
jgi:hypothetical protein